MQSEGREGGGWRAVRMRGPGGGGGGWRAGPNRRRPLPASSSASSSTAASPPRSSRSLNPLPLPTPPPETLNLPPGHQRRRQRRGHDRAEGQDRGGLRLLLQHQRPGRGADVRHNGDQGRAVALARLRRVGPRAVRRAALWQPRRAAPPSILAHRAHAQCTQPPPQPLSESFPNPSPNPLLTPRSPKPS